MAPQYSIIIPTKDRPEILSACLASLEKLENTSGSFEVIIVDDGSDKKLDEITEQFASAFPIQLYRQTQPQGPAAARNKGAENAQGKYLIFLDDDCSVDPHWLHAYDNGFATLKKNSLVGQTKNPDPSVIGARVWCLVVAFLYDYWQDQSGNLKIAISNNFAVERAAFADIGGFGPTFKVAASEDRNISWKLNEAGYEIAFCPGAVVWHSQPNLGVINYLKLQYRYGYYANIFDKTRNPITTASFSNRFGNPSRLRYALHLFRFALKNQATISDIAVLYLGHISHYLGRIGQSISIRRNR